MKASTRRAMSLLGTAGILIATLAVYSLFLRPAYADINTLRGDYSARQETFVTQSGIMTKVRKLIAQYQGTTKIQDTIALTLPQDESAAALVAQLQAIASASGLIAQSMNLQTGGALQQATGIGQKGVHALGTVQVTANLAGPYEAFKSFIGGVESNIRLMDVTEWSAAPIVKGKSDMLAYTVVINAYYQAE